MAPNACPPIINHLAFLTEKAALLWKIYQLILESSCLMCHLHYSTLYKGIKRKKVQKCVKDMCPKAEFLRGQDGQFFLSNNCSYFT